MDSIWTELANLGISCTPAACLVSAAKLVKLIWETVDSVKSNKAQCLVLVAHTKDILVLVSKKTQNQDAEPVIHRALISLDGVLRDILIVLETQKQASLLKRIIKKDAFHEEIVRLYDRISVVCHLFGIKSQVYLSEQNSKQEEARQTDHTDLMSTMGTSLQNDQILLDTLGLQHEQYLEAMAVMQRSLKESFRGAIEVQFLKRGITILSQRSFLKVPSPVHSWQITMFDDVIKKQRIGSGAAGQVYQGTWQGIPVGIKELRPNTPRNMLRREIEIWNSLKHPNIVPLYGASIETEPFFMVSKYYKYGNASEFLRTYPAANRLRLLLGIARGCRYLHSRTPPIIHGDLKGSNVLIDVDEKREEVALLADFGLSRIKSQATLTSLGTTVMPDTSGTLNWMAPERFRGKLNETTDVYAFSMTAWELLAGEVPWLLVPPSELRALIIYDKSRPDRPPGCSDELWSLVETCWAHEASERPTFEYICRSLEDMLQGNDLAAGTASLLPSPKISPPVTEQLHTETSLLASEQGRQVGQISSRRPTPTTASSSYYSPSQPYPITGPSGNIVVSIQRRAQEHNKLVNSIKNFEESIVELPATLASHQTTKQNIDKTENTLARSKGDAIMWTIRLREEEEKRTQYFKIFRNERKLAEKIDETKQKHDAIQQQVKSADAQLTLLREDYRKSVRKIEDLRWIQGEKEKSEETLEALYESVLGGVTPEYPENEDGRERLAAARAHAQKIRSLIQNRQEASTLLPELKEELDRFVRAITQTAQARGSNDHAYKAFSLYIKIRNLDASIEPIHLVPKLEARWTPISEFEFAEIWKRHVSSKEYARWMSKKATERDIIMIEQHMNTLRDSPDNLMLHQELTQAEEDVTQAVGELRKTRERIFARVASSG